MPDMHAPNWCLVSARVDHCYHCRIVKVRFDGFSISLATLKCTSRSSFAEI